MPDSDEPVEAGIDYARLAQEALRDVARLALDQVAREGLPGEHHLYISFCTVAAGVRIPPFLLDLHPEEMTIVLQQQFWDLIVDREAFSVTLAFGGSRHPITVPFSALTTFVDPSVPFGLRWEEAEIAPDRIGENAVGENAATPDASSEAGGEVDREADGAAEEPGPSGGEEGTVVSFDRFRRGSAE